MGKPPIPGPSRTIKKGSKQGSAASLTRTQAYGLIREVARRFAQNPDAHLDLPSFIFPQRQRRKFLDRAVDEASGALVANDKFGSRFRSTWPEQDELFSTASTRNFIMGLLKGVPRDQVDDDVWQRLMEIVDLISTYRIPTHYSGFSTSTEVMQHPTAVGEGIFSPSAVAGKHGSYDSERVKYIGRAIQAGERAGLSDEALVKAMFRAALEFSLNHFTAPATASNIKPFSTKASVDSGDASLQDQLASRERIKDHYVWLGGRLRDLPVTDGKATPETPEQSWDRPWQLGLTITAEDRFPVAPPSPRRSRRAADTSPLASARPQAWPSTLGITSLKLSGYLAASSIARTFAAQTRLPANITQFAPFMTRTSPAPFSRVSGLMVAPTSIVLQTSAVAAIDTMRGGMQAARSAISAPALEHASMQEMQNFAHSMLTDPMDVEVASDPGRLECETDSVATVHDGDLVAASRKGEANPAGTLDFELASNPQEASAVVPASSAEELQLTPDDFPAVPTDPLEVSQVPVFENPWITTRPPPAASAMSADELALTAVFPSVPTAAVPGEASVATAELEASASVGEVLLLAV